MGAGNSCPKRSPIYRRFECEVIRFHVLTGSQNCRPEPRPVPELATMNERMEQNVHGCYLLITKNIGHQQVFLVSHLTYLVQLLYLGKLSRPKFYDFSVQLLIFANATLGC